MTPYQLRYGFDNVEDNDYYTNEFIEKIIGRSTHREFTDQKIDDKLLQKLFAAAQSAPTSSMFQTWSAIIIDKEHRHIFKEGANAVHLGIIGGDKASDPLNLTALDTCDIFIVWCVDMNIMETVMKICQDDSNYQDIKDNVPSSLESLDFSTYQLRSVCDSLIAAQTFCLAAESMGLGSMFMGSIKTMDLKYDLNLPNRVMPLMGVCIGYPKKQGIIKPRLPQNLIIHHNTYKNPDKETLINYNQMMEKFYSNLNVRVNHLRDWFVRIILRTSIGGANKLYRRLIIKYGFKFL